MGAVIELEQPDWKGEADQARTGASEVAECKAGAAADVHQDDCRHLPLVRVCVEWKIMRNNLQTRHSLPLPEPFWVPVIRTVCEGCGAWRRRSGKIIDDLPGSAGCCAGNRMRPHVARMCVFKMQIPGL